MCATFERQGLEFKSKILRKKKRKKEKRKSSWRISVIHNLPERKHHYFVNMKYYDVRNILPSKHGPEYICFLRVREHISYGRHVVREHIFKTAVNIPLFDGVLIAPSQIR